MASDKHEPKQKTRPTKGKPVDIPVPKRKDVLGALKKIAPRRPKKPS